jgi:hypothetical protein
VTSTDTSLETQTNIYTQLRTRWHSQGHNPLPHCSTSNQTNWQQDHQQTQDIPVYRPTCHTEQKCCIASPMQDKGSEDYHFLECGTTPTGGSSLMFWADILHPSSRSDSKPNNQQEPSFSSQDAGTILIHNVSELPQTTEYQIPRGEHSSTLRSPCHENSLSHIQHSMSTNYEWLLTN